MSGALSFAFRFCDWLSTSNKYSVREIPHSCSSPVPLLPVSKVSFRQSTLDCPRLPMKLDWNSVQTLATIRPDGSFPCFFLFRPHEEEQSCQLVPVWTGLPRADFSFLGLSLFSLIPVFYLCFSRSLQAWMSSLSAPPTFPALSLFTLTQIHSFNFFVSNMVIADVSLAKALENKLFSESHNLLQLHGKFVARKNRQFSFMETKIKMMSFKKNKGMGNSVLLQEGMGKQGQYIAPAWQEPGRVLVLSLELYFSIHIHYTIAFSHFFSQQ